MKKNRALLAIILIPVVVWIVGCASYHIKPLDKSRIDQARTALVIDTDFLGSIEKPYNAFNLRCEDMSKDECNGILTRLQQAEGKQRADLMASLADIIVAALDKKGLPALGLDKKKFFDSKQFPMEYPGDKWTYCAVSRNYSSLAQQGYTHVLYMGFPNRVSFKKDAPPALFFGVEAFLFDVRPVSGDMSSKENRLQRQEWCYHITPTTQSQTTSQTYDTGLAAPPGYKIQRTVTTTTYTRDCLGIALIRRNGTPYTMDELFTGSAPVYFELYKHAARYGLTFASKHLAGERVYSSEVKKGVGAEDLISPEKIKDLSKSTLEGHAGGVSAIAFHPNGKTIASGGLDKSVKLWDAASGTLLATLSGHTHRITSIAYSPDGKTIVSGSGDKSVKLWDTASGKLLATITGHSEWVQDVAFSPDGKTIASCSGDKSIKLWDAASGKHRATLSGHTLTVYSVAFSPDGKTIASGGLDKSVKLWDAASGKLLASLNGHSDRVTAVAFSPDSKTIASGGGDKTIKLWDAASGKLLATLAGHSGSVLCFSPDGKIIASVGGSGDKSIKLSDTESGKLLMTLTGHSGDVISEAFSPDGRTIASGSIDGSVKLWDAAKRE